MGKSSQGVFGHWSGKVGNVVGRVRQGQNIYAIYQPNVANPRTASQMATRNKFTLITKFGSQVLAALQVGFADLDGYKHGTPLSSFIGYNLKNPNVIVDNQGVLELQYSYVMLSQGSVELPLSPSATLDSNTVNVTWTDNSGTGKAEETDKAYLCVYNPAKKSALFAYVAARSARNGSMTLPAAWNGDSVEAWFFMSKADGKPCSPSTYLGSLNL